MSSIHADCELVLVLEGYAVMRIPLTVLKYSKEHATLFLVGEVIRYSVPSGWLATTSTLLMTRRIIFHVASG